MKRESSNKWVFGLITAISLVVVLGGIAYYFFSKNSPNPSKLDNQLKSLESRLESAGELHWNYERDCQPISAGAWPTGEYLCSATISSTADATLAQDLLDLHDRYYSAINSQDWLKPKTSLTNNPSNFGDSFIVSSAEQFYKTNSGFECNYLAKLSDKSDSNQPYGSLVQNGSVRLSLACSTKTDSKVW